MTVGITRYWALRQGDLPGVWTLGHLYDDGSDPLVCALLYGRSASVARDRAEEWLRSGGEVCERWTPAVEGWIATTRSRG